MPTLEVAASFDHFVGADQQCRRKSETERLCRLRVHNEAKPGRLFDREIGGLFTLEYLVDKDCGPTVQSNETWAIRYQSAGLSISPS